MLPADYLKRIRRVEIRTRHLAEDFLVGAYRSVFKGRGLDFADVRAYAPGDDVRFIDWNVTARMDAPYVKEFKEEREINVLLAVDVSGSGEYTSAEKTKRELAAEVAACLALSATANGDKVGLLLFSDRVERYLPPRKGRAQVLRIIRDVLFHPPAGRGTSLGQALNFVNHIHVRRAIVFLLSDFLDAGFERPLRVACRRHDLIPVVVADRRELELPDVGWVSIEDAETGEICEVDTGDPARRAAFALEAEARGRQLRHLLRRAGVEAIMLRTDLPYLGPIRRYMEQRLAQRAP